MAFPHVLVVMPLYNARPYVRAAVQSVLAQTYPSYSVLVINDGSTDGSEQDVASFEDDRVTLWHQENQGPGAAMNRAIQYAKDRQIHFIARVDADDLSMPDRLERQVSLMLKRPDAAACSANCYYIDPVSERILGTSTVAASSGLVHWEIAHGLRGLIQPACLFRTSALGRIGGYRSKFKLAEEVDVFLRLAECYPLTNCTAFLVRIRLHPSSLSMRNVQENIRYQFYALDCAKSRKSGKVERDFASFLKSLSWRTRAQIWREQHMLEAWRTHVQAGRGGGLLLASLLDPRRLAIRGLRMLDHGGQQ